MRSIVFFSISYASGNSFQIVSVEELSSLLSVVTNFRSPIAQSRKLHLKQDLLLIFYFSETVFAVMINDPEAVFTQALNSDDPDDAVFAVTMMAVILIWLYL